MFIHTLSILDSQTHQLRPAYSTADMLDYPLSRPTLANWKSGSDVRILSISGLSGSGTTAFSSWVLGGLLEGEEMENAITLSFKFSRSHPRARSPFGLYLSLCRQLVSFQPHLFSEISAAARFWTSQECFTTECLWILFRSMVMSIIEKGGCVYCLICYIDHCVPSSEDTLLRMEELVKSGNGQFKLLYTQLNDNHPAASGAGSQTSQRRCIALDNASQEIKSLKEQHIRSRIQDLVQENLSWDGLAESALT